MTASITVQTCSSRLICSSNLWLCGPCCVRARVPRKRRHPNPPSRATPQSVVDDSRNVPGIRPNRHRNEVRDHAVAAGAVHFTAAAEGGLSPVDGLRQSALLDASQLLDGRARENEALTGAERVD